jgi:hypothetical protein
MCIVLVISSACLNDIAPKSMYFTVRSESRRTLRLRYVYLVVSIEVALKCAVVLLYSAVKQRLKCNTGNVCNCLIALNDCIILRKNKKLVVLTNLI